MIALLFVLAGDNEDVFSILEEEQKVVTLGRVEQKRSETSLTVEVITGEDIVNSGIELLPELLRRFAGLDVTQTTFSDFHVGIRGQISRVYEPDKVLLLLDGRPATNDATGSVPWNSLGVDFGNIERIEIVRGPGTALYGGIGMMGVVNIITKTVGDRPSVALNYAGGVTANGSAQPAFRVSARQAWVSEDKKHELGFALREMFMWQPSAALGNIVELHAPLTSLSGDYAYRPKPLHRFALSYWGFGYARNFVHSTLERFPSSESGGLTNAAATYTIDAADAHDWSMQSRVAIQYLQLTATSHSTLGGTLAQTAPTVPIGLSLETLWRKPLPFDQLLTVGADLRPFLFTGAGFTPGSAIGLDLSAFAADQIKLTSWMNADANLRVGTRAYPGRGVPARALVSPRMGFSFPVHPQHTLRLSASYAQRPASPAELFAIDQLPAFHEGNPALRPEGVGSLDLGYELRMGPIEAGITPYIVLYHSIRELSTDFPPIAVNQSTLFGYGGEATLTARPTPGTVLRANYSMAMFRQKGASYAAGAPHKLNVSADVQLPAGLNFNGAAGFVSRADYFGPTADTYPVSGPLTVAPRFYVDLSLRWKHATGWNLQLSLYNATRVGPVLLPEYPGAAPTPVGPRVMLAAGYEGPNAYTLPADAWQRRWYTQVLWAFASAATLAAFAIVPSAL